MAKRHTVAALSFLSDDGVTLTLSTEGTRAAPAAKLARHTIDWGNGVFQEFNGSPPPTISFPYERSEDYTIKLRIFDSKGATDEAETTVHIVRNPIITAPLPPTLLSLNVVSSTQIDIFWSDVARENGYQIERSVDGGVFILRTLVNFNVLNFSDTQVTAGHTYTYRVRAFNEGGNSAYSNELSGDTSVPAEEFDIYVAPAAFGGNDSNDGLTEGTPLLNWTTALARLQALGPGHSLGALGDRASQWNLGGMAGGVGISIGDYLHDGFSWLPTDSYRIAAVPGHTPWLTASYAAGALYGVLAIGGSASVAYIEVDGINIDPRGPGGVDNIPSALLINSHFESDQPHHIRYKNSEIIIGWSTNNGGGVNVGAHSILSVQAAHHIEMINCHIHGEAPSVNLSYAIYFIANDSIVEYCHMHDSAAAGIHCYNDTYNMNNNTFRYNIIHDIHKGVIGFVDVSSSCWGIISLGNNAQIYGNVIYSMGDYSGTSGPAAGGGITIYGFSNNVLIARNSIYNMYNNVRGIFIPSSASSVIVTSNIAYLCAGGICQDDSGLALQTNNSWQPPVNGIDPKFVSEVIGAEDLHLTNISPCINQGAPVSVYTEDPDGVVVPQGAAPDQGAYEYSGS